MTADVDIRVIGRAGRITLRRPGARNALNHAMVRAISDALADWAAGPSPEIVVIDAEGPRAFCAGGDIAALYHAGRAGDVSAARDFWRDEYRMVARIARHPVPVVTLMQGLTLGGGVGLGCHAACRIIGESSRIGLPQVAIGLMPDAGATALLARAPGALGAYLALTADRIGPGDAIACGLADHHVPEAAWPDLVAAMETTGAVPAEVALHAPPDAPLAACAADIDVHFAQPTLGAVARSLSGAAADWAEAARAALARHDPLAMACAMAALDQLRADGAPDLDAALALEYRFAHRALSEGDFLEGVRAALIDRDGRPAWRIPTPMAVSASTVAAMLAPVQAEAGTEHEHADREARAQ